VEGKWITTRNISKKNKLYLFRKTFYADTTDSFHVKISADSRYRLYMNGAFVSEGPCKGHEKEKHYEEFDASSYLSDGENIIEVIVLNITEKSWESVTRTSRCALWFLGKLVTSGKEQLIISDQTWDCRMIRKIDFLSPETAMHFVQQNEYIDLTRAEGKFEKAKVLYECRKNSHTNGGILDKFYLVKRTLPPMEYGLEERFTILRNNIGLKRGSVFKDAHIRQQEGFFELDARSYTTAYPELRMKANKGTVIKITYAECYYPQGSTSIMTKSLRDDETGVLLGDYDVIISDGNEFLFVPYWFRSFRYVRIDFSAVTELHLQSVGFHTFHYPLEKTGVFFCSDKTYEQMWTTSVNTVKCCMHEIYEDCPYHEQQQYVMDSSLIMLYAFRLSADGRLASKAILEFAASLHPTGFLAANYPASYTQIIPGFSLFYVKMVYDYYMYSGDDTLVNKVIGIIDTIMTAFGLRMNADGLVGKTGFWEFVDWVDGWENGSPNRSDEEPLTVYNLMYSAALLYGAQLCRWIGRDGIAREYEERKKSLDEKINCLCYDQETGLFANVPNGKTYSQHCQLWAVIAETVSEEKAEKLMNTMLTHDELDKCSFSMNFFLMRALRKCGMYSYADKVLDGWKEMLENHCTSWGESLSFPRSECHGWSSAPIFEFSAEILGVKPYAPGYAKALIEPFTDSLESASGTVPTVKGNIKISWRKKDGKVHLEIDSPSSIVKKITVGTPFESADSHIEIMYDI